MLVELAIYWKMWNVTTTNSTIQPMNSNTTTEVGYCFKTPRAIQMFGNASCCYDWEHEVPLSV
jgi:hypothetical protein